MFNRFPSDERALFAYMNGRCPYCNSHDVNKRSVYTRWLRCDRCMADWYILLLDDNTGKLFTLKEPSISPMEIFALEIFESDD